MPISSKKVIKAISKLNPESILLTGFDDALLGIATKKIDGPIVITNIRDGIIKTVSLESEFGLDFTDEEEFISCLWERDSFENVTVYSMQKIIEILMKDMSEEDAIEYYYYNVEGGFLGDQTPIFLHNEIID